MVWRFLARLFLFHHLLLLLFQSSRNTAAATAPLLAFPTFFIHWDFSLLLYCSLLSSIHKTVNLQHIPKILGLCFVPSLPLHLPKNLITVIIFFFFFFFFLGHLFSVTSCVVGVEESSVHFFLSCFPSWAEGGGGWISGSCFHVQCFVAAGLGRLNPVGSEHSAAAASSERCSCCSIGHTQGRDWRQKGIRQQGRRRIGEAIEEEIGSRCWRGQGSESDTGSWTSSSTVAEPPPMKRAKLDHSRTSSMSDDPEDEEDSLRLTLGPPGSSRSSQSSQDHHLRPHQQLSQSKEEERYRPRRTPVRTPPPSSSSQSTLSFSHTVLQIPLQSEFFAIPLGFLLRV